MKLRRDIIFSREVVHENFRRTRELVLAYGRLRPASKVVVVVGPPQAGKSQIAAALEKALAKFYEPRDGQIPVLSLVVATAHDGRISPRHLNFKMLKALRHPVYMHIGEFDELEHYVPAKARGETAMRIATELALLHRGTEIGLFDESHHFVHTGNASLRDRVLESIKCLMAMDRTLFLFGGYELVYAGLFDSPHFSGRVLMVEMPPYTTSQLADWCKILESFEGVMQLDSGLLVPHAKELLAQSNGSFGLLEKIMIGAKALSMAANVRLDMKAIRASYPPEEERQAIAKDIRIGQAALKRFRPTSSSTDQKPSTQKTGKYPFRRKPKRDLPEGMEHSSE